MPDPQPGQGPAIEVETRRSGGVACFVLRVAGDLDERAPFALREETAPLVRGTEDARLVLDLTGVTSCDSAGAGALLAALKRTVLAGGRLALAAMPPDILRDFRQRGLDRAFTIHDTVEQALEDLRGPERAP
ncbi:STAS domain-containing protein [Nonomuraea antri]|uniref:STAS domain-containing protein n=1 Tax=Nonomuraea antri TaxID=2730852 RepID=UPI001F32850F|nr:STAS domain-containing protein [Nonomuraea antri]